MNTSELQKIKLRYNIVGNSDELNRALDVALQVAPTDLSVLIIGESGVGKEIIPKVIHDNSPRRRENTYAWADRKCARRMCASWRLPMST